MELTNVKNGTGFVTRDDLFNRLARTRSSAGLRYEVARVRDSIFSQVTLVLTGGRAHPLFKIMTATEELYGIVCDNIRDIAAGFHCGFEADNWGH